MTADGCSLALFSHPVFDSNCQTGASIPLLLFRLQFFRISVGPGLLQDARTAPQRT